MKQHTVEITDKVIQEKLHEPQMFITDLDGTLLRSDGNISERTKAALKRCKGQGIQDIDALEKVSV